MRPRSPALYPDWLVSRPIAHRGLHDAATAVPENSASAFAAAIAGDYAIECDLQLSGDGEAMVFHDATVERMTGADGRVDDLTVTQLQALKLGSSGDSMQTLAELLAQVRGAVPLVIELKSHFDGKFRLAARTVHLLTAYDGPVAVMSFDPDVVAVLRLLAPELPRGIVADQAVASEWPGLNVARRAEMRRLTHLDRTNPHFLSWDVRALPAPASRLFRQARRPVICWTVRDADTASRARSYCDQITFEGFVA